MTHETMAVNNVVLQTLVGSTAHGTGLPGHEDTDLMGVAIEPREYVIGLQKFENYIYRTAGEGQKSGPNDTDLTIYSLRKWARLACAGNPSVLIMLFSPDRQIEVEPYATTIRESAPYYVSKECGKRFLGYMESQRAKFMGEKHNRVQRPELVAEHGYDTKFAMHMLRLGYQGAELLDAGRISLPMVDAERDLLLSVRHGEISAEDVLAHSYEIEEELVKAIARDDVPEHGDRAAVDAMLINLYQMYWDS